MASYTATNARDQVKRVLRDLSAVADERLVSDADIDVYVTQALSIYSQDVPVQVVEDVTASGTSTMALPPGWQDGFSEIISLESPLEMQPPMYLDRRDWEFYMTPSGLKIRWTRIFQPSGRAVRVLYTKLHVLGATTATTTVADNDFHALCDLAVSYCADSIANKYARTNEPVLNADIVNYQDRARVWTEIAKRYNERYRHEINRSDSPRQASQFLNWDQMPSPAREYIFHRKENR